MYMINIGGVQLSLLPPEEAVTLSGGERPITERRTLSGAVIATRPARAGARRLVIEAPDTFVITQADADAIQSLPDTWTLSITGFKLSGTFLGCTFEVPPQFPSDGDGLCGYSLSIYIPQQ